MDNTSIGNLIESGGVVALAAIVWLELRGLRKDLVGILTKVNDRQHSILERQLVMMDRMDRNDRNDRRLQSCYSAHQRPHSDDYPPERAAGNNS